MRTSIIPILFSLFLLPGLASAASVDTENFTVEVTETNGKLEFSVEIRDTGSNAPVEISVEPPVDESTVEPEQDDTSDTGSEPVLVSGTAGDIVINEFVSDPIDGSEEWVELYNTTSASIDLTEWFLIDGSGKKTILEGNIASQSYMVVYSPKGILNNGGDMIGLYDAFASKIDEVSYGNWDDANAPKASDPESVGLHPDQADLFVVMEPTPGSANIVQDSVEAAANDPDTDNENDTSDTTTNTENETDSTYNPNDDEPATCHPETNDDTDTATDAGPEFVALSNIRNLEVGTMLATEGVVSAVPGQLGKQVFYLAGSGIQVYLHSAEFPQLDRGTRVRIEGELRESSGESRVKLSDASDIQILGSGDAPTAHDISTAEIGESTEGWLVRLTGMVAQRSSNEFYLEDSNGEVRVYIKDSTGIVNTMQVGDEVTVTGVVSETRSGYRLLPRDQEDILPRTSSEDETDLLAMGSTSSNTPSALGGWVLSATAVLGLAGAGAIAAKKKNSKWNKTPQTA